MKNFARGGIADSTQHRMSGMAKKKKEKEKKPTVADARQVAALPYKRTRKGALKFLIMTSRGTRRFVIPKGWPMKRLRDHDAAAREAFEEAGVRGKIQRLPIGVYVYWKRMSRVFKLVEVDLFPLRVTRQAKQWPEKGQRAMAWLKAQDAILLLDEPMLKTLVKEFVEQMEAKGATVGKKKEPAP